MRKMKAAPTESKADMKAELAAMKRGGASKRLLDAERAEHQAMKRGGVVGKMAAGRMAKGGMVGKSKAAKGC